MEYVTIRALCNSMDDRLPVGCILRHMDLELDMMFEVVSQRVSTVYTMVEARDVEDARVVWERNGTPLDASEFVDAETVKRITPYDDPFDDEDGLTQFEEYTDDDYLESSN